MKKTTARIAVLIPCFNEGGAIAKVVADFLHVLPNACIYVYDNNSTDDTVTQAKKAGAIVRHEYQQGKGNVIRRMFREIDADCYILVDGDNTYPADAAKELAKQVLDRQADMVVGDRLSSTYYTQNKRRFHNFGNNLVKNTINYLFRSDIKDIMSGYRAFSHQFVKTFPVLSSGFEIETEMTIHALDKNLRVVNVPIAYRDRAEGSFSKLNTYSDGAKVLTTIFVLYKNYKPLAFFGSIASVLFVIASAFMFPIIETYLRTGLVPQFPTLIVCVFVMMASIQSLFAGLILSSIAQKNRRDFEYRLIGVNNEK